MSEFSDTQLRFSRYRTDKFFTKTKVPRSASDEQRPSNDLKVSLRNEEQLESQTVNDFDIQIYKVTDEMQPNENTIHREKLKFQESSPRSKPKVNPRSPRKHVPILPSLLENAPPQIKTGVKTLYTENDRLRARKKILNSERDQEIEIDKKKRLNMLDNLIETHLLMKLYEDSSTLADDMGVYNRVQILNQIWTKICSHEGQLQPYLQFLQREVMKYVVTSDPSLLQCIQMIIELQHEQFAKYDRNLKVVTFVEACEIMRTEVDHTQSKTKLNQSMYSGENQSLRQQLMNERKDRNQDKEDHEKHTASLKQQLQELEIQLMGRLSLKDQENQQLIWQIQELKDGGYKQKEIFEQERVRIIEEFNDTIREQNIKIFEQKGQLGDQKEQLTKLKYMCDNYRNKFLIAFASMKSSAERIRSLEAQKSVFVTEQSQLSVRAACQFSELTPRPDLTGLESALKIERRHISHKSTKERIDLIHSGLMKTIERLQQENVNLQTIIDTKQSKLKRMTTAGEEKSSQLHRQVTIDKGQTSVSPQNPTQLTIDIGQKFGGQIAQISPKEMKNNIYPLQQSSPVLGKGNTPVSDTKLRTTSIMPINEY